MPTELRVECQLTGTEISNDEITRRTGISPTRTWKMGDSIQGTLLRRPSDGWVVAVSPTTDLDLDASLEALFKALAPAIQWISQLPVDSGLRVEIHCAIYLEDAAPIINLKHRTLAKLAELGATLDVDIIQIAPSPSRT